MISTEVPPSHPKKYCCYSIKKCPGYLCFLSLCHTTCKYYYSIRTRAFSQPREILSKSLIGICLVRIVTPLQWIDCIVLWTTYMVDISLPPPPKCGDLTLHRTEGERKMESVDSIFDFFDFFHLLFPVAFPPPQRHFTNTHASWVPNLGSKVEPPSRHACCHPSQQASQ